MGLFSAGRISAGLAWDGLREITGKYKLDTFCAAFFGIPFHVTLTMNTLVVATLGGAARTKR